MSITLPVVSKVLPIPVTLIVVEADGRRNAKRRARGIARQRYGIQKPVVLNEREAAVRIRQMVAAMQPAMPELNGNSGMCFDNRYSRN